MKAGKYTIKELFTNRYIEQIVIPEIQRDYVWREEQVTSLIKSIYEDFTKYSSKDLKIPEIEDIEINKSFQEYYKKRYYSTNIGFIYAYNDAQYNGKYFLIDGQQRITTIYLILLELASSNIELRSKFKSTYLNNGILKLDYKVRESAQIFIKQFLSYSIEGKNNFMDSKMYYDNLYSYDVTIQSILKNKISISEYLIKQNIDPVLFYDYIENMVEFWYFDTNISEQGEELYIFMNARGEQMQGNENTKAALLSQMETSEEKNKYGLLWEEWQDFFWNFKNKNENADHGFNQFLACIAGLERYISGKKKFYSKNEFDSNKGIKASDLTEILTIEVIRKYIDAFKFLITEKDNFKSNYSYCAWVEEAVGMIWTRFNDNKINWFADFDDENRATERRSMVYIWSVFLFITQRRVLQKKEVFEVLRIYWVRYNNNIRSVKNIVNEVSLQVNSGIWKESIYDDERCKFNLFNRCDPNTLEHIKEIIWEIEDHKLNIDGSDVGNVNISHLVDFRQNVTLEYLTKIKEKFYEIFGNNTSIPRTLKNILLHYGEYYDETSPYYYTNLCFSNSRRIIRGIGSFLKNDQNPFKEFFTEFIQYNGALDEFWKFKNRNLIKKEDARTLQEKLLWYSQNIGEKMWEQGDYIAVSKGAVCSLPFWENQDRTFVDSKIIFNTKGDLRGGTPCELHSLL
jgi:uncharacterized protein with ParB-like and HNH nuclease domain